MNRRTVPTADVNDPAHEMFRATRQQHWDAVAAKLEHWSGLGTYYQCRLAEVYGHQVPPRSRVLEIGCGTGDLLASLKPSYGVGVDISAKMIALAQRRHPEYRWLALDESELDLSETFDAIILSDIVNDVWDVQGLFDRLQSHVTPRTRLILNTQSQVWQPLLSIAQKAGLAKPSLPQNWLTVEDLSGLLTLSGFEVIRSWSEILMPVYIPMVTTVSNRFIAKLWPFRLFDLANFIVARPAGKALPRPAPRVSVVVPARNESGNIARIMREVPDIGGGTELIFVEGHSTDDTLAVIRSEVATHPERSVKVLVQSGRGKGDAVRLGIAEATGDILMILDADLTVAPHELSRFYDAIAKGQAEFVNGVRLVYPMEAQAMRFANLVGNKFFSLAFSWLLGQPVKDTLCGTKVLRREDYTRVARGRSYFGDFDPFGDFDLLFGAARLNLKIMEIPVRYRERTYGTTNIQRWRHGWLLLKMVIFAAGRIKFV